MGSQCEIHSDYYSFAGSAMSWRLLFSVFALSCATACGVEPGPGGVSLGPMQGRLTPADVRGLDIYDDWENTTDHLDDGTELAVANGKVKWQHAEQEQDFAVISKIMNPADVKKARKILDKLPFHRWDKDMDSVDAMPTEEFYIHEDKRNLSSDEGVAIGRQGSRQKKVRKQLAKIMAPIEEKITAYIRKRWPKDCDGPGDQKCRSCHSLVRRYKKGERRAHQPHRDGHAIVTAVVSLSDFDREYRGGLYVAAESGAPRQALRLNRGDLIVHQYGLLHGVHVEDSDGDESYPAERWSWIMWFKDSSDCDGHKRLWSEECAKAGNPVCQLNHASQLQGELMLRRETSTEPMEWMLKSAQAGLPEAMFSIGVGGGKDAIDLTLKALHMGDPDAAYRIAQQTLAGDIEPPPAVMNAAEQTLRQTREEVDENVTRQLVALRFFERAAAAGSSLGRGSIYAMYNLGVAWLFGFAGLQKDPKMAFGWFQKCGLPEGFMAMAVAMRAVGNEAEGARYEERARKMGFGSPIRRRDGGSSLHSAWPPGPPQW